MLVTKVDLLLTYKTLRKQLELIIKAIEKSGFKAGEDVSICLDVAANELNEENNNRLLF